MATAVIRKKSTRVRDFVLETVRKEILVGTLVPGQRLVETELCERLGVSRPSVREALRQLEAERIVKIEPYRGPSVARVSWAEAEEIYFIRELLEGQAAALFAQKATQDEIKRMRAALGRFRVAVTESYDREELLESTTAFYDTMLDGCGVALLAEILRGLLARINLLRSRSMSLAGRPRQSLAEMAEILASVERHDAGAAERAAKVHVRNARAYARDAMQRLAASESRRTNPAMR